MVQAVLTHYLANGRDPIILASTITRARMWHLSSLRQTSPLLRADSRQIGVSKLSVKINLVPILLISLPFNKVIFFLQIS